MGFRSIRQTLLTDADEKDWRGLKVLALQTYRANHWVVYQHHTNGPARSVR